MTFRQAKFSEVEELFREGYRVWSRNRTYEQYCVENRKEDAYGTRYVIDENGKIVSSLILLRLKPFSGMAAGGIGSVVTHEGHTGKGYATALIKRCIALAEKEYAMVFLYSDIDPAFYLRFGFRALPSHLQKKQGSVCMVRCAADIWNELYDSRISDIPAYF